MNHRSRLGLAAQRGPMVSIVLSALIACGLVGVRVAVASPPIVDLLASRGSRLGDDLRRELGASGFLVVSVEGTSIDWRADVRRLAGHPPIHGVVVRADERLMTVFTRAGATDVVDAQLEQIVDPRDRLARRRACLSVVEYLRVLSENDPPAAIDLGPSLQSSTRPPPSSASAQHAAAPLPAKEVPSPGVGAASGASSPAPTAVRSESPGTPALSTPSSAIPHGSALAPAPAKDVTEPPPDPRGSFAARVPAATAEAEHHPVAAVPLADDSRGTIAEASEVAPSARYRGWEVGAGSTLDLEAAPGGPTVHLQFLWYLPLEWRLALCVRALWPVLGVQYRTAGSDVRAWTFGGAASLQYLLRSGSPRLRPFVGAALGTRVALTETTPTDALQSRETFTPSITLGAEAGVRYGLSTLIQLFLEVGVVHGRLVPGVNRAPHEVQAANSESIHASFGVLFEI